jgi:hypothetical protein
VKKVFKQLNQKGNINVKYFKYKNSEDFKWYSKEFQAIGELLLANYIYIFHIIIILTDCNDYWTIFYFIEKTINNALWTVILEIIILHLWLSDNLYLKKKLIIYFGQKKSSIIW